VVPLAGVCTSVVGVDVSEAMLAVVEENSREMGLSNVTFVKGDDTLSGVSRSFDFVHSFIVFQHIRPERGGIPPIGTLEFKARLQV
jgi:ubiquinone/menaquinone biosynthesis C-methylase UbiE